MKCKTLFSARRALTRTHTNAHFRPQSYKLFFTRQAFFAKTLKYLGKTLICD